MERRYVNRRDFIKLVSVGAAAVVLSGCDIDFSNEAADRNVSNKLAEFIKERYKLTNFYFGDGYILGHNDLYTYPLSYGFDSATHTVEALNNTFNLYPDAFFDNLAAKVKWGYLLGEDLKHYNADLNKWEDWGGTITSFTGEQVICGERRDVATITHHELFHLVANNILDKNSLYSGFIIINSNNNLPQYLYNDNFTSISGCVNTPPPSGFSRCYGQWNAAEDSATIAESLMTGETGFYERLKSDVPLSEKAEKIKIAYSEASGGVMNDMYFESIRRGVKNPWSRPEVPPDIYK